MGFCEGCMSFDKLHNLNDTRDLDGEAFRYVDLFYNCFNLKIFSDDPSSHFICDLCIDRLVEATRFRWQVLRTRELLVQNKVKLEADDFISSIQEPGVKFEIECDAEYYLKKFEPTSPGDEYLPPVPRVKRKYTKRCKINKTKSQRLKLKEEENVQPQEPQECTICDKNFKTEKKLQKHMSTNHREYLCYKCGYVTRNRNRYNQHLDGHFEITCPQCDRVLKKSNLKSHMHKVHKTKRFWKCQECGKALPSFEAKIKHLRDEHQIERNRCQDCDKIFRNMYALRQHVARVHGKERHCFCHECGKGFFNEHALKRHMIKHTGERKFVCDVCCKGFLKKDTLTAHMRIHKAEKDFVCSVCSKAFTYKCSLKGHMQSHHPDVPWAP